MKTRFVYPFAALIVCSGAALADCGTASSYLNVAQVNSILTGNFACGKSSAINPPGWNERHTGSPGGANNLVEQHEGGTTTEIVGSWNTANAAGRGRVTYSYVGGTAPVYEIAVLGTTCAVGCTTLPQTYAFCGVGGGAPTRLAIFVSTTFQAPVSVGVMNANCPANP
jgi:hypothetical protein